MLPRERVHLDSLSARFKWETTRRHPIYLWLWETFQILRTADPVNASEEFAQHQACQLACLTINVSGIPVDPARELEELLDSDTTPRWLNRAAQPVSYRYLAQILTSGLPSQELRTIAAFLFRASEVQAGTDERKRQVIGLEGVEMDGLDFMIDLPIFQINPSAPAAEFTSDLTKLRNEWRVRHGIPDSRTNEDKFHNYLRAWDMREGWHNGTYHRDRVMKLRDVASSLEVSKANARNWYKSGFRLVSSHEFSPDNWVELMGATQLSSLMGDDGNPILSQRIRHARDAVEVDETTISSGRNRSESSVVDGVISRDDGLDAAGMIERISSLISEGRTNAQILDELELDECVECAIESIRENPSI